MKQMVNWTEYRLLDDTQPSCHI